MQEILKAINDQASPETFASLEIPKTYRAAHILKSEETMFAGVASKQKDPRKSIHIGQVATPELAPDECLVAVMASSINFNTVWSAIFEPISTFGALARLGKESAWAKRHDLDYHVLGSDASGVILRTGAAVRSWKPGDQLMAKPKHLTWEEAAVNALCNSTSYRMLVSKNGAAMKQGDVVLIWGATGGIGAYAVQYVLNGGGIPVGVVSSPEKAQILREMGCEAIIDRKTANYKFWNDDNTQNESEWRRLGKDIRALVGEDPDIVFEHPGRSTFGASIYVVKRGGTVVSCAATSGFMMEFDNRHFWMRLKRLIGSHFANYREAFEANRLISKGMIHPVMSQVFSLNQTGEAAFQVHNNLHEGKLGVLCLAPKEGMGITDPELRAKIGEEKLTIFRRAN